MGEERVTGTEPGYRARGDEDGWLRDFVRSSSPLLEPRGGVVALLLDASAGESGARVVAWHSDNLSARAVRCVVALATLPVDAELRQRFAFAGPVGTLARTFGRAFLTRGGHRDMLRAAGISDALYVLAGDPLGVCAVVAIPRSGPVRLTPSRTAALAQLAAQLAAALRLRRDGEGDGLPGSNQSTALRGQGLRAADRGAVDVATSIIAAPPAALRRAALEAVCARGLQRGIDADAAAGLWAALLAGRWTLVDRFDRAGRRYLIAMPNPAHTGPVAALSAREAQIAAMAAGGQANKLIAYELVLSPSTVAVHLRGAMAKLGVRSRVALAGALRGAAAPSVEPGRSAPKRARGR